MPEHVHLLIRPRSDNYSISSILQSIKQPVSRKILAFLRENRPDYLEKLSTGQKHRAFRFWLAGGGYDRNIKSIDTCRQVIRYIHANPVRRKLVDHPSRWYYSSFNEWMGNAPGPLRIDKSSFFGL